jgi:hypothetical protein
VRLWGVRDLADGGLRAPRTVRRIFGWCSELGHAEVSMTQDNYFGRKVAQTDAAQVLEIFGDQGLSRAEPWRYSGGGS